MFNRYIDVDDNMFEKVRMCLRRGEYRRYIFRNILAISNPFRYV